jgi:hypothetical protein
MITKIVKWSAIVALVGMNFSRSLPNVALILQFTIVAAAVIVFTQAAKMHRYIWMSFFLLVAALLNPVIPIPYSTYLFGVVTAFAMLLFFFSLELLQAKPRLSLASITNGMPGSESL